MSQKAQTSLELIMMFLVVLVISFALLLFVQNSSDEVRNYGDELDYDFLCTSDDSFCGSTLSVSIDGRATTSFNDDGGILKYTFIGDFSATPNVLVKDPEPISSGHVSIDVAADGLDCDMSSDSQTLVCVFPETIEPLAFGTHKAMISLDHAESSLEMELSFEVREGASGLSSYSEFFTADTADMVDLPEKATQTVITADEEIPISAEGPITALTVDADVSLDSDDAYARAILIDTEGKEYLVFEAYHLLNGENELSLTAYCEETCILDFIEAKKIRFEVGDAEILLNSVDYSSTPSKAYSETYLKSAQVNYKIEALNDNLNEEGLRWTAGRTSISDASYSDKLLIFNGALPEEGSREATLPNLYGLEFYSGGIFETGKNAGKMAADAAPHLPESWDWRDAHGENWITPVKKQGWLGTCWAFAAIGTLEASVNLWYNRHLDLDLSEQNLISCTQGSTIFGGSAKQAFIYGSESGVVDEACFEYLTLADYIFAFLNDCHLDIEPKDLFRDCIKEPDLDLCFAALGLDVCEQEFQNDKCLDRCDDPEYTVVPGEYITVHSEVSNGILFEEASVKEHLMRYGPAAITIPSWKHIVVLVGWEKDPSTGRTVWIMKNSYGTNYGEDGFMYMSFLSEDVTYMSFLDGLVSVSLPSWELSDEDILCLNRDNDDYCSWGLSTDKPISCPSSCTSPFWDLDDSDPSSGYFDQLNEEPPEEDSCGDGFCDSYELYYMFRDDCVDCWGKEVSDECGDGICQVLEHLEFVPCGLDCEIPDECGDGICSELEQNFPLRCPEDCVNCGDGVCGSDEDSLICSADCPNAFIRSGDVVSLRFSDKYLSINSESGSMELGLNANRDSVGADGTAWEKFKIHEIFDMGGESDLIQPNDIISLEPMRTTTSENDGVDVSDTLKYLDKLIGKDWIHANAADDGEILHLIISDAFAEVVYSGDLVSFTGVDASGFLAFDTSKEYYPAFLTKDLGEKAVLVIELVN